MQMSTSGHDRKRCAQRSGQRRLVQDTRSIVERTDARAHWPRPRRTARPPLRAHRSGASCCSRGRRSIPGSRHRHHRIRAFAEIDTSARRSSATARIGTASRGRGHISGRFDKQDVETGRDRSVRRQRRRYRTAMRPQRRKRRRAGCVRTAQRRRRRSCARSGCTPGRRPLPGEDAVHDAAKCNHGEFRRGC